MPWSWGPWSFFPYAAHMEIFFCWPLALVRPGSGQGRCRWVWQPAGPARRTGAGDTLALPVIPGAPSPAIEDVPHG